MTSPLLDAGSSVEEALSLCCDERDQRFLAGGNFFGRESASDPERDPLAVDLVIADHMAAAVEAQRAAAAAKAGGGAAAAASSQSLPPLMVKLGGKGSAKTPP